MSPVPNGREPQDQHTPTLGNINELLQHALKVVRHKPARATIDWDLELQRPPHTVRCQEERMFRATVHVMENVVESISVRGRISFRCRHLDPTAPSRDRNVLLLLAIMICIEITDTNGGIPAEVLPRVFEPFFTTKADQGHRSLGLAWVYGVVTGHWGGVAICSEAGRGTSVRIYPPAEPFVARPPSPPPESHTVTAPSWWLMTTNACYGSWRPF